MCLFYKHLVHIIVEKLHYVIPISGNITFSYIHLFLYNFYILLDRNSQVCYSFFVSPFPNMLFLYISLVKSRCPSHLKTLRLKT